MNTQTITIKGDGKLRGSYSDLDMGVFAGCKFASKKQINNNSGIAVVTYIFETESECLEDWVVIEELEKYACEVMTVR